jgi:hypothetical protein
MMCDSSGGTQGAGGDRRNNVDRSSPMVIVPHCLDVKFGRRTLAPISTPRASEG